MLRPAGGPPPLLPRRARADRAPCRVASRGRDYSTISPGLIIEEGKLAVEGGKFAYEFDPWATGERFPFFDTVDCLSGRPALCDTVVFNLFFEGKRANGEKVFGVKVVAMRGDAVINANVK